MRNKTKTEKPSLMSKAATAVGWAWYDLKTKISARLPKRKKQGKLGAKRKRDAVFVYAMLLLPLIQFFLQPLY